MKCVTKPITYEFVQWTGDNYDTINDFCGSDMFSYDNERGVLKVLYRYNMSWQMCYKNDYIVKTRSGWFRVIQFDDFDRLYSVIN